MSSGYMVSGKEKINLQHNPSMSLDDVFTRVSACEVESRPSPASPHCEAMAVSCPAGKRAAFRASLHVIARPGMRYGLYV